MDDRTQPQTISESDFETIKPTPDIQEKTQSSSGKLQEGLGAATTFLRVFREDQPFSNSLIAIIGFIVIASFGHMTGWPDFSRYIIMVILAVLLNKVSSSVINIRFDKKMIPWLLTIILLGIVIFQNYFILIDFIRKVF